MSGEAWLYLLAVLINAVNLFLQVFFTIMYSDLEWSVIASSLLLLRPRNGGGWERMDRGRVLKACSLRHAISICLDPWLLDGIGIIIL